MRTIVSIALTLVCASAAADNNPVVPPEAAELTRAHRCTQLYDYFVDRPRAENPPYALVNGDFGRLDIAVWCSRPDHMASGRERYLLLVRIDEASSPLSKCPAEVSGIEQAGGLRFGRVHDEASGFFDVQSGRRVSLRGSLDTQGIYSFYDGAGEILVCIGGKWAAKYED